MIDIEYGIVKGASVFNNINRPDPDFLADIIVNIVDEHGKFTDIEFYSAASLVKGFISSATEKTGYTLSVSIR